MARKKTPQAGALPAIKFDAHNFRKHSDENKKMIHDSLAELGAGRSVVIDKENELIAGNGVYEQAQKLGMPVRVVETDGTELVVVKRTDLATDDAKRKKLAAADNAISDHVEWNAEELRMHLSEDEIKKLNIDLSPLKIGGGQNESSEAQEDDFDEAVDKIPNRVQPGEVWQLGEHRLMCGDSTNSEDVARLMDGELADMVSTDPPYNVAIGSKNKTLTEHGFDGGIQQDMAGDKGMTDVEAHDALWMPAFENMRAVSKDDCTIYIFMPQGGTHMMMMMAAHDAGWQVKHELIWVKNAPTFSLGRLNYDYQHEPILYGWNKSHKWYTNEHKTSLLYFDKPRKCDMHPTMKPVGLWAELIGNSSEVGGVIADFFGGSGTTIIACEQLGRKARLMELDPHYCDVIIARWEKLTGQTAVKL